MTNKDLWRKACFSVTTPKGLLLYIFMYLKIQLMIYKSDGLFKVNAYRLVYKNSLK